MPSRCQARRIDTKSNILARARAHSRSLRGRPTRASIAARAAASFALTAELGSTIRPSHPACRVTKKITGLNVRRPRHSPTGDRYRYASLRFTVWLAVTQRLE